MSLRSVMLPDQQRSCLARRLDAGDNLRLIEAHSGLSAMIASRSRSGERQFDGLWASSLTGSATRGLPDSEMGEIARRLDLLDEILAATDLPVLVDGDTGGTESQMEYFCNRLETRGASGIIVEDQCFPKRNSLSVDVRHELEDPERFAAKISRGKRVLRSSSFRIIARIESFIAGYGLDDALVRARAYLCAGADGLMIHSKNSDPSEVFEFLRAYHHLCQELGMRRTLVVVPTTYNQVSCQDLFDRGANVVIHANHLLRAAHLAMEETCHRILETDRSYEAEKFCSSISDVFELVGYQDLIQRDLQYE
jgi:phosphoenolpyruvate phosphomutase